MASAISRLRGIMPRYRPSASTTGNAGSRCSTMVFTANITESVGLSTAAGADMIDRHDASEWLVMFLPLY
jgi:hypothetical protein